MTTDEASRLLEEYRSGIDAELNLLRQLEDVARSQHEATAAADFQAFNRVADRRDAIMRNLVALEEGLRGMRTELTTHRSVSSQVDGFAEVAARHREASDLVHNIMATDQLSLASLANAELARRSAMASLERGENTLAAYRRVLSPPVSSAKLVDKTG